MCSFGTPCFVAAFCIELVTAARGGFFFLESTCRNVLPRGGGPLFLFKNLWPCDPLTSFSPTNWPELSSLVFRPTNFLIPRFGPEPDTGQAGTVPCRSCSSPSPLVPPPLNPGD